MSEDDEFSAKVPDSAMREAIKAAAPKFGPPGCHMTIETARILGLPPSVAFRGSFGATLEPLATTTRSSDGRPDQPMGDFYEQRR